MTSETEPGLVMWKLEWWWLQRCTSERTWNRLESDYQQSFR
jgi:hypothetical protein